MNYFGGVVMFTLAGITMIFPEVFRGVSNTLLAKPSVTFQESSIQIATASVDISTFRKQILDRHNQLRARHGSPPLKLADNLNNVAQAWAEYLVKQGQMVHHKVVDPNFKYGENLAYKWSSNPTDITGDVSAQSWYDEIAKYNWGQPGFTQATGHFTQVVWKSSTEIGCGKARSSDGKKVYVVCNYNPPGNYQGQFPQNVARPK